MIKNLIQFITVIAIHNNSLIGNFQMIDKNGCKEESYKIEKITPKNDAFHGIKKYYSQEWWYFDAVFDENYGIHMGVKVITFGKWGFVRELINIYKDEKVIKKEYKTRSLNEYQISKKFPDIKHKDKQIIKFDYYKYKKTGEWNYKINLNIGKITANFKFIGKSKGFTYKTSHEGWTVAQPKAKVTGNVSINNEKINLEGIGYHDHNWNFSIKTAFRGKGWYWGKITSSNYSLTWANIIKNILADDTISEKIGILSIINKSYKKIDPGNIKFIPKNYEFHNGRYIPTEFTLYALQDDLEINVSYKAISIQRNKPNFLTIHYYRYFISVTGFIRVGENIDYLDDETQIMEHLRFI